MQTTIKHQTGSKKLTPPQRYTVNTDSLTNTTKPTESQINIYTDGSLTDEHAGSGYTIQYKKRELIADSIRLPMHTTVFQAEIIACLLYTSPSPRDKRQSRMPSSA